MRVLIDSTAAERLPDDVARISEALRSDYPAGRGAELPLLAGDSQTVPSPTTPMRDTRYPLERWLVQAHAYNEADSAKIGILGWLFAGDARRVKGGVIHDAKRFSLVDSETSGAVEIGVAVRLSVATSQLNGNLELTLPNLAAAAQLNHADTRVGISVVGYCGHLGDLLPAPRKLDVETYVSYVGAFRQIQELVFGDAGWRYVYPTVLSYEDRG